MPDGTIRNQRITDVLTRPIYAGYVSSEKWGVSLRKGHHEALINFETFQRIQDRLVSSTKAPARKDISKDFPLRGFVVCDDCDKPMTSCWSTSKTGEKHPYYICKTKDCESYRKSIRRADLEGDFEGLLEGLQPTKGLFTLAKAAFLDIWDLGLATAYEQSTAFRYQAKEATRKIQVLVDRIVESESDAVVAACEARIERLERERILAEEKAASVAKPRYAPEDLFELAFGFLSSPYDIYKKGL